uniref:FAD dependent oxidoreductase domain-containing protein n=1 Tax=Chlamydomonas euryale TaxID=1486919 RepID=A0A6U2DVL3_9CHLO|mmetsp:Transcript_21411/g.64229  ORF Transcript_21411/g.64229 Transcript_21411/m.64229 type:complete len:428 (+) Transcript_21411:1010-2293(+)
MLRRTSLAYHLSRLDPDVTVALVDGRHIAGGATGRNGGLLWPCLNASFKKMLATKGVASSSEIMRFEEQASTAAADFIEQTPGMRELVEFAWLKEGGLYLFESEEEAYDELQELKAMTDRGWSTDLEVWGAAETNKRLGSVGYHGAIRYPKVGKVWAARWALGVALQAAKAAANGACGGVGLCGSRLAIFEGAKATAVDDVRPSAADYTAAGLNRPHGLKVHTSRGDVISARAVVHCTNAYSSALLPELRGLLIPVRNHVAATAPLHASQAMLDIAVYARRGYVYWSPRPDGRLVFGGFRDEVPGMEEGNDDDANLDQHIRSRLHEYLPAHFPSRFDGAACGPHFEMEWAGILGFTADRFPLVGALPAAPPSAGPSCSRAGQFICAGFSGHGMTRAFSSAEGLARQLLQLPGGRAPLPLAFQPHGRM